MRSLYEQFKNDHIAFMQLWQKWKKGTISIAEKQEFDRVSCWLREELRTIRKLRKIGIEEAIYGEIEHIENKLKNIEININRIMSTGGGDYRPQAPAVRAGAGVKNREFSQKWLK